MAAATITALALGACRGGSGSDFALDGSPRIPDDEGIVTAVDLESVTLDGERTYDVERDLRSFSAIDLSTVPLLFTEGQYVQVGVDGDTLEWIGAIAKPLAAEQEPFVLYAGELEAVDGDALVFDNGTVLRLADAVEASSFVGEGVRVSIDPDTKTVTEVVA